jgi:SAM-dependent methyltransferase
MSDSSLPASGPNADQIAYWNDTAGQTWATLQDLLDRQIAPLGRAAMARLAPAEGEAIADIGCGCGETVLALARAVGPAGSVTGLDISEPMLEVARRRIEAEGLSQASVLAADAQTHAFTTGGLDAVYSRFGVMFFHQPVEAFANMRAATRAGGRLAFVCWRPLAQNPWMGVPMQAALRHLPAPPPPADPHAPGPFAFADPDRLRGILTDAGWSAVDIVPHDEKIGGNDLERAMVLAQKVGPLGMMLRENPQVRDQVLGSLREVLSAHLTADGVMLDSATWLVTARA